MLRQCNYTLEKIMFPVLLPRNVFLSDFLKGIVGNVVWAQVHIAALW